MSKMLVEGSGRRIQTIDEHVGAAVAGLLPDARQLVTRARDECRGYKQNIGEPMPPQTLAEHMGGFMHLFTVYWYFRPAGAAVLLAGYDREKGIAELYCAEPTGQALVSPALPPRALPPTPALTYAPPAPSPLPPPPTVSATTGTPSGRVPAPPRQRLRRVGLQTRRARRPCPTSQRSCWAFTTRRRTSPWRRS